MTNCLNVIIKTRAASQYNGQGLAHEGWEGGSWDEGGVKGEEL